MKDSLIMKSKVTNTIDVEAIRNASRTIQNIRSEAVASSYAKKNWGYTLPWEDFAIAMSCLTAQTYGTRIANRIAQTLGLSETDDPNLGDKKNVQNEHQEIKGALITTSNDTLNLVQIRPWQNVDYIVYCFDVRNTNNVSCQFFYLTRQQMEDEMVMCGTTSAHGTKDANLKNKNKELALRLDVTGSHYKRWEQEYAVTLSSLKVKLMNSPTGLAALV